MSYIRFTLALLAVSALYADTPLDSLLKAVESRYNKAETLQVQFQEAYTLPNRPTRSESGTLTLQKPGRMRWDYTTPQGKLFVSDGKSVYLYTPASKRVEKMKLKESEDMRAPLAFLLGKLHFQKEFQNIQSRPESGGFLITAKPKSDNLPYTDVEFLVTLDCQIRRVKVTGYDKSILVFDFTGEKVNPIVNRKIFDFQKPADAELVESTQ